MIKKTVTYEDYNEKAVTEDFYFHISKADLLDNMDLRIQLTTLAAALEQMENETSEDIIQEMINIIRDLIRISYGVRSEDGKRFRKSEDIYLDFRESAAYDSLLFGLFADPDSAIAFMRGIMPKDLLAQLDEEQRPKPQDRLEKKPASDQKVISFDEIATDAEKKARAEELERQLAELNEDIQNG